jgi:hypothetical protein
MVSCCYVTRVCVLRYVTPSSYCNGPLPFNGQLVTDIVSAATDADVVSAATVMYYDWIEAFPQ